MPAPLPEEDLLKSSPLAPNHFYLMLFQYGLHKEDHKSPYRQQALLETMRKVQDHLLRNRSLLSANPSTSMVIVGQTHNDPQDAAYSLEYAKTTGVNKEEVLMLERNGELHPQIHKTNELAEITGDHSIVLLEKDILGEGLSTVERSWLIGMYLANLIAEGYQKPISLIIGENHSKDIEISISVCLQYMGHSPSLANIKLLPSSNQTLSTFSGKPLTLDLLKHGKALISADVKIELPSPDQDAIPSVLDDFSELFNLENLELDENYKAVDEEVTHASNRFKFWKQPSLITINSLIIKLGPKDARDIKLLLDEEAINCNITTHSLRDILERYQDELEVIRTTNDLLILISEVAERISWGTLSVSPLG